MITHLSAFSKRLQSDRLEDERRFKHALAETGRLTAELEQTRVANKALQAENESLRVEYERARLELADVFQQAGHRVDALQSRVDTLEKGQGQLTEALVQNASEHTRAMTNMVEEHRRDRMEREEQQRSVSVGREEAHRETVSKLQRERERLLARIEEEHKEEVAKVQTEHERAIVRMQKEHRGEVSGLQEQHRLASSAAELEASTRASERQDLLETLRQTRASLEDALRCRTDLEASRQAQVDDTPPIPPSHSTSAMINDDHASIVAELERTKLKLKNCREQSKRVVKDWELSYARLQERFDQVADGQIAPTYAQS